MIEIHPLPAIGEVKPGDDLARLLVAAVQAAGVTPTASDVLAVTQKIVSKAEGRFVDLMTVTPGQEALKIARVTHKDPRLIELVLAESQSVVRAAPHVLITRHRSGHVMANAGIDRSNIGPGGGERALLLPVDADASAAKLREALAMIWPKPPAVLIIDSFGRPWRYGVTCVAIGASGLPSLVDRRGHVDRDGRVLEVTQIALGDMIATAAGLATGEDAEGIPAALVHGVKWSGADNRASALVRPIEEDLFR
ncbi:coenzyme F420-0:L-glutamate ligase [Sphingobium sp.]|uniref:coenzyme F420-0:L-glutamate ligase n=1 Tax=Sphingobium sp. TaxID=1912891 RepID=UPI0028BDD464|nr:coenzyme F420-0:L-glutamate ligase [Sphingobium sp.]